LSFYSVFIGCFQAKNEEVFPYAQEKDMCPTTGTPYNSFAFTLTKKRKKFL